MRTALSEWTKLRTTASLWWTTVLFIVFGVGFIGVFAVLAKKNQEADVPAVMALSNVDDGIQPIGLIILIIQAIMVVTSEYRFNFIATTFQTTPNRTYVAFIKWLVYAVFTAILTFLCLVASLSRVKGILPDSPFKLTDNDVVRLMWALPLEAVLVVTFAMAVAWLVRQTAGAVSIVLIWYLVLESLLVVVPKVGPKIHGYLPFVNLNAFYDKTDVPDIAWGYNGSLLYFIAWAVGLFVIGVVLLNRRDA